MKNDTKTNIEKGETMRTKEQMKADGIRALEAKIDRQACRWSRLDIRATEAGLKLEQYRADLEALKAWKI
jgi:hypothetical protein